METLTASRQSPAATRLEFEVLISDLSARFVNLPPDQVTREIGIALGKVREFLGADRCGLLKVVSDKGELQVVHDSQVEGMPPPPMAIDYCALFPWGSDHLIRRGEFLQLHTRDYPPEAAIDRASIEAMGVKSFLSVPISSMGAVRYLIASATQREEKVWPKEYIPRLRLVGEIFVNTLERKRADEALRKTIAFEEMISGLSARFVNVSAGGLDREIEDGLGKVRTFLGVDRCGLFRFSPETGEAQATHVSLADGIPAVPRRFNMRNLFPWIWDNLVRRREILHLHVRDFPPEASVDRANAEAIGVKTNLTIPILSEGSVKYAISVNSVLEEKIWPEEFIQRLQLVGEIFVNVLERKQADEALRQTMEEVQRLRDRLQMENVYLREQLRREDGQVHIVGESDGILKMLAEARRVAPTDSTVLITGETGTGKELLAQAIHDMSRRSDKTMVTVHCAALPPTLIESELFGREKGAYTGATTRQIGRIEVADGSTLFLDEMGDLPVDIQVKLLRVLQDGRFERLGSHQTRSANVRVIAATHRDLHAMVRAGSFREDLFHRLNVYPIEVPPLRERIPDIPLLVWLFVQEFNRKMGKSVDSISRESMERLQQYPWPGNVRELRNLVERAMIGCDTHTLTIEIPPAAPKPASAPVTMEEAERNHILGVLKRANWRIRGKNGAAEILGLPPTTLHSRMKKLGISRPGS
jgi:transcriptional regulator with GAF, ATPase, and Fis domain